MLPQKVIGHMWIALGKKFMAENVFFFLHVGLLLLYSLEDSKYMRDWLICFFLYFVKHNFLLLNIKSTISMYIQVIQRAES